MNRALVLLALATVACGEDAKDFKFSKEQSVYVVGLDNQRNGGRAKADLQLERLAKDQFRKSKAFRIASTVRSADFVFFVMLDPDSTRTDETAMVVLPAEYERAGGDLDALRGAALWQSDNHVRNVAPEAALAVATGGLSVFFHHPDVVAGLVKRFCAEVLK